MHLFQLVNIFIWLSVANSLLQPRESETREVKDLSGMWSFRADYSSSRNQGFDEKWYSSDLSSTGEVIPMPVPSSYNDITVEAKLRDFVGWVWYETKFFVSRDWFDGRKIMLRFGSAHYNAVAWMNSEKVVTHSGGHLPFEADVTSALLKGGINKLTVAVNNTLTPTTLPPGTIQFMNDTNKYPPGYFVQNLQMDFFNYAGIHRPVLLYTLPKIYVEDIVIQTSFIGTTGFVNYSLMIDQVKNSNVDAFTKVNILDKEGKVVNSTKGNSAQLSIENVKLWWPFTMSNESSAYLYTLEVTVSSAQETIDIYRLPFGVRTVNVTNNQFFINQKPFYCHGVAKHEDADIRGKGVDLPLIARDFNLLKWMGANCFRTSHYPYAEEIMDEADRQGVVVIDECPGVGIKEENFGKESLEHHKSVMKELVDRDKNRPSVVMWSVANEPSSSLDPAKEYFREVISTTRDADPAKRPVTFVVGPSDFYKEKAAQYVDVLCINHYYAWYSDIGHIEVIGLQLKYDLYNWHKTFNKPIIMTEYGADTIAGLHALPSTSFTEDYQVDFLKAYHSVFDELRKSYLVGEMVWNFADFMTVQGVTRAVGNRKGLFTRHRQPKASAHIIKQRYNQLVGHY